MRIFATTVTPIVIVLGVIISFAMKYHSDKDGGGAPVNPIVSLVRKLRGEKNKTPEELATTYNEKIADEVFKECDDSVDEGTGLKIGRPMNPIILLVRRLRAKGR